MCKFICIHRDIKEQRETLPAEVAYTSNGCSSSATSWKNLRNEYRLKVRHVSMYVCKDLVEPARARTRAHRPATPRQLAPTEAKGQPNR